MTRRIWVDLRVRPAKKRKANLKGNAQATAQAQAMEEAKIKARNMETLFEVTEDDFPFFQVPLFA
jgi:hypothetical protein